MQNLQDLWRKVIGAISTERLGWEIGWTMVYFLLAGALLWAFAAILRRALRPFSAQSRYAASLLCLTAFALLAPGSFWAVRNYPEQLMLVGPAPRVEPVVYEPIGDALSLKSPFAAASADRAISLSSGARLSAAWREFRTALFDEQLAPVAAAIVPKLPWIWVIGSSLMMFYFSCGLMGADRLRRECDALDQEELGGILKRLCREMGVTRRVGIGMSDRVAAPLVLGVLRPMILLPMSAMSTLSVDQLEFVLLHELAHVRRYDNLVNLFQRLVEAIAFFHPAAWRISAWVRLEREHCCDAAVLRRRGQPSAYAETLASLAMPGLSAPYAVASLANHQLVSRVRHILQVQEPSMRFSSKWFVATAMALLVTSGFVAAFAQTPDKPESKNVGQKKEAGQTFTIEFKLDDSSSPGSEGSVLQFQVSPDSSYASVAEMLKSLAATLDKQGKHPHIKVKSQGHEKSWNDWTKENCASCHTTAPGKDGEATAEARFSLDSTCAPGVVQWLELALEPSKAQPTVEQGLLQLVQPDVLLQDQAIATINVLSDEVTKKEESPADWSTAQAVGPPNTFEYSDARTAWASKSADGQQEWLLLTYEAPVNVEAVLVHETYNPGAIARVEAILPDEQSVILYSGQAKAIETDAPRVFLIKPKATVQTARIRITIDSAAVPGWNEIDAVGILDGKGTVHWAKEAKASSSYADGGQGQLKSDSITAVIADSFHLIDRANGDAGVLRVESKPVEKKNEPPQVFELKLDRSPSIVEDKKPTDAQKLQEIEQELDALQRQLLLLREKLKSKP